MKFMIFMILIINKIFCHYQLLVHKYINQILKYSNLPGLHFLNLKINKIIY